jgi:hypothetical protein
MFSHAKFNQNISKWKISSPDFTRYMFKNCRIKDSFKPKNIDE